jgi:hypothetical protein
VTARTCNLKCWVAGLPGDLQRWQRLPGPRRWVEALHRAERRGGGAAATEDAHRATRLDGSCAPTWYLHKAKSTAKCCGWCWVQVGDVDPLFWSQGCQPFRVTIPPAAVPGCSKLSSPDRSVPHSAVLSAKSRRSHQPHRCDRGLLQLHSGSAGRANSAEHPRNCRGHAEWTERWKNVKRNLNDCSITVAYRECA